MMEISCAILKIYVPVFKRWKKSSEPERQEIYAALKESIEKLGQKRNFSVVFETDDTTREPWIEFAGTGWTEKQMEVVCDETSSSIQTIEIISRTEKSLNASKPAKAIDLSYAAMRIA